MMLSARSRSSMLERCETSRSSWGKNPMDTTRTSPHDRRRTAPRHQGIPGFGVVVSGTAAGLTLGAGVAIQPLAKHMERQRPGQARRTGLILATVGLLIAAAAFEVHIVWLIAPIALALGGAYGLLLVSGLRRVEDLAHPDDRAAVNAFFYALTYVGFAAPLAFSELTAHQLSPSALMIGGAVLAAATSALRQWPAEPDPL
jgi:hypothetical protein